MKTSLVKIVFLLIILLLGSWNSPGQPTLPPIIPKPAQIALRDQTFQISRTTIIRCVDAKFERSADFFNSFLLKNYDFMLNVVHDDDSGHNEIIVRYWDEGNHDPEKYTIGVGKDRIIITGGEAGVFYAFQTLQQILLADSQRTLIIPGMDLSDYPRFPWRGMHLDVARHFFTVDFIKKYIDLLAMYKFNVFHWHLTDDQGWRIEIKKYPRLTQVGAYRNGSMIGPFDAQKYDSIRYGGFYTQDEIRGIVAYARQRHVTIVPEIEMPGHSIAALASYPELSCTGGPFEVGKAWGVYDDVFCPKEETFEFLENVLSEICELFPGKYIHIGGDEVPKDRWKKCRHCQALIKREGLKDENGLESYFVRRIEKYLNSKGKRIFGWDEILEGGIAPNAAVMSWRGTEGGIAAAKMNHSVVMTPGDYCYFDHYQGNPQYEPLAIGGYTTVEKVYSYEPVPSELTPDQQQCILGAQGNIWTEYIDTPDQVEYMALPRMIALAEVDWTPKPDRDYPDFQRRLLKHFSQLDKLGIHYAKSIFAVTLRVQPMEDYSGIRVGLFSSVDSSGIYYTINGEELSQHSEHYHTPIAITDNSVLRWAYLKDGRQTGVVMEQKFVVTQSTGKHIYLKTPPHNNYPGNGAFTLVDGIRGDTARFGLNWIGFWGPDLDAVIDLGHQSRFSRVSLDFYNGEVNWIYLPKDLEIFVSNDTLHWASIKKIPSEELKQLGQIVSVELGTQVARYVRVVAENAGKIPDGKPGAGHDAWLFVDEIMIE